MTFNLIDKPWIQVQDSNLNITELSIRELFHSANDIIQLTNELPAQDFAILRVLLAIIHRSIEPMIDDDSIPAELWSQLWNADQLPIKAIDTYLDIWHHRFDILDPELPFMQAADIKTLKGDTWELKRVIPDVPNNKVLFTTYSGKGPQSISYAEAARLLVHTQAFDPAGVKSPLVGDPDVNDGKRTMKNGLGWAANLGGIYLTGNNLKETLLLNLVLCNNCYDGAFDEFHNEDDLPVWERPAQTPGDSHIEPSGPCSLYTWQLRRMRLIENNGRITNVIVSYGDSLQPYNQYMLEPMTAWNRNKYKEKTFGIEPMYFPTRHKAGKSLWQGLTSYLPQYADNDNNNTLAPGVILWAGHLCDPYACGALSYDYPLRLHATGYIHDSKNTIIYDDIDDTLIMSPFLLSPQGEAARVLIKRVIENTDKAVNALGIMARRLRLINGDSSAKTYEEKKSTGDPHGAQLKAMTDAYFELDTKFRRWASSLNESSDLAKQELNWNREANRTLWRMSCELIETASPRTLVGRRVIMNEKETYLTATRLEKIYRRRLNTLLPTKCIEK